MCAQQAERNGAAMRSCGWCGEYLSEGSHTGCVAPLLALAETHELEASDAATLASESFAMAFDLWGQASHVLAFISS